jgi:lipopolysaccharide/colanic/teichoic acid biosynthesis glycosyltransferase
LYGTILSVQGVFYLGSIIGFIAEKFSVKIPCVTIAYSFVLTQIAIVCGFLRYSSGREDVMWDKTLSYSSTGGIHNRIIRLLSDSTLFCFGIIVSFYLRYRGTPPEHIFSLFANLNPTFEIFETNFAIPLVMLVPLSVFYFFKLNETRTRDVTPEFILTIAKSVFFTTIVMMLLIYNMRNVFTIAYEGKVASFPTAVLVMSFFINCFILAGWRFILKNIIYPAKNKKDTKTRTTVFSNAEISSLYLNKIQNRLEKFNSNLEAVSARSLPEVENIKTLGNVSEEINNMSPDKTDWLWLDTQSIHKDEVLIAIDNAEKYGIHTSAIPGDLEAVVGGKRLQLISYIPVINVANKPLNEGVVFIKKGFDIISALIMFFIGLPGAFIYVISGGKFHRNAFYGMHGKKLNILRLSGNKANKGIIAFSAKILCWSWHILKGDFSLVGYMPIPESIWRKSSALEKSFCTMRPGIITPERLSFIKREKIRRSFISVVCYTKNFHLGKDLNIIANYFFKGK